MNAKFLICWFWIVYPLWLPTLPQSLRENFTEAAGLMELYKADDFQATQEYVKQPDQSWAAERKTFSQEIVYARERYKALKDLPSVVVAESILPDYAFCYRQDRLIRDQLHEFRKQRGLYEHSYQAARYREILGSKEQLSIYWDAAEKALGKHYDFEVRRTAVETVLFYHNLWRDGESK